jgi:hypothetical protein
MEVRGFTIDVSSFGGGRCWTYHQHPQVAHHQCIQHRWWPLPKILTATHRGAAIDVFSIGGGRCQKSRQQTPGAPPSTSSTLVVVVVRPTASSARGPAIDIFNFDGGRYRTCRQHPQGATIDVFSFGGGHCWTCRQHPQGAHHRCLQHRWWPLLDLQLAALGGPPSTSPASVVAAAGPAASTPQGATINVFNFGGGRCWTCRQHPLGGRHQHLQLRWWPLSDLPIAPPGAPPSMSSTLVVAATRPVTSTPRGPAIDGSNSGSGRSRKSQQQPPGARHRRFAKLGTCHQNFSGDTYQGALR